MHHSPNQGRLGSWDATLALRKPDGTMFEGLDAQFSAKAILIMDVANLIEPGDMLIRILPNGLRVGFIMSDPGYREALGNIPAHFEVKAHRAAPIDCLESSGFWRERRAEFEQLASRQRDALGLDQEHPKWLRGYCSRLEEDAGELAYSEVDGGLDAEFRSKFDDVATQVAIALGNPANGDPVLSCLSCLCLDLLQNSSEAGRTELLRSVPGGGFIVDLLGSSAAYCSRLAKMVDLKMRWGRSADFSQRPADLTNRTLGETSAPDAATQSKVESQRSSREPAARQFAPAGAAQCAPTEAVEKVIRELSHVRPQTAEDESERQNLAGGPDCKSSSSFFEVAVDPCGNNPFPQTDPRHEAWRRATRHSEQGLSEITALIPEAYKTRLENEWKQTMDELVRYGRPLSPISM
jgi:hypothetical protein